MYCAFAENISRDNNKNLNVVRNFKSLNQTLLNAQPDLRTQPRFEARGDLIQSD